MHVLALLLSVAFAAPQPASKAATDVAPQPQPSDERWEATVNAVADSVVSIKVTAVRDFDTEDAGTSLGTGFVVDAEQGLILTNRHMVHSGPVIAEAVFLDHREVKLQAVYRDPIHDFGVYRYDPKELGRPVAALELAPHVARRGMPIRVIGNDAGEKLAILDGTLARLDRNAPDYGGDTYNDWNTFYFEAASNTSGGSSGSPVVGIDGRVVALNAGGSNEAASSFFLPLDRVVPVLERIRKGEAAPRGGIGAIFEFTPYDELRRLGLTPAAEAEARARFPSSEGLLVVSEQIESLPGAEELVPGDVLIAIDGKAVAGFAPVEERLDAAVGGPVSLQIERGGKPMTIEIAAVADLHALSPDRYLEMGRAVFNTLSLQQARNGHEPPQGVYLAVPGYWLGIAGIPEGAIIEAVDGIDTPTLDAFRVEMEKKAQGQRIRLRWHIIGDPRHTATSIATVDRLWYTMQSCVRDDTTGMWPCTESPAPPAAKPPPEPESSVQISGDKLAAEFGPSLVVVRFDVPYPSAGLKDTNYVGTGLVIDAEKGLVLVDRDTVPVALGDMTLTFAGSVRVPGRLVYLHPVHNFAVVAYDPSRLGEIPVKGVEFADHWPEPGDKVWQVGLDEALEPTSHKTAIEEMTPLQLSPSGTPRFRDADVEAASLVDPIVTYGGALIDKKGRVIAPWLSFVDQGSGSRTFYGLPSRYVIPTIEAVERGEEPTYRWIGAEFGPIGIDAARDRAMPEDRLSELTDHDPGAKKILMVTRRTAGTDAWAALRDGDILVEVDGEPVTEIRELEPLSRVASTHLLVVREGNEVSVDLSLQELSGRGTDRVASWSGLILHAPHFEVASQTGIEPLGVYASWMWYGAPASTFGLRPTRRIVAVNDVPTPDLDAFLAAVEGLRQGESVRLKMQTMDDRTIVQTLKVDPHYWPTQVFERAADGTWTRTVVDAK